MQVNTNKNTYKFGCKKYKYIFSYARHLGKYRIAKSSEETARKEAKIISTVGSKDKKIVRKYAKDRATSGILRRTNPILADKSHGGIGEIEPELEATLSSSKDPLTCVPCDKSFGVRSLYMRHISQKHPYSGESTRNVLSKPVYVKLKNCGRALVSRSDDQLSPPVSKRHSKNLDSTCLSPQVLLYKIRYKESIF